jgi:hypothetical protein
MRTPPAKPGDLILNRYMPNASDAEREEARQNLYGFAATLVRIAARRADETILTIRAEGRAAVESVEGPKSP